MSRFQLPRILIAIPIPIFAILLTMVFLMAIPVAEVTAATTRTIQIDPIADDNPGGGCTLREAVDVANAGLGSGLAPNGCLVIENGAGPPFAYDLLLPAYTYTMTGEILEDENAGGDLDLIANISLIGAGPHMTILDGDRLDRLLDIPIKGINITVNVSDLSIQNGLVNEYDLYGYPIGRGGGIRIKDATMTMDNCVLSGNTAEIGGGLYLEIGTVNIYDSVINGNQAQAAWAGGGISIQWTANQVNIAGTSISENTGFGIRGNPSEISIINSSIHTNTLGGIYSEGTINIANSTIAGNLGRGGITSGGQVRLTNVTVTGNTGLGINNNGGQFSLKNSIVAGNLDSNGAGADCDGTFITAGYNLIGSNSGCISSFPGGQPNANNDYVGTSSLPLDPKLANLVDSPAYYLLKLDSPALDKSPTPVCTYLSAGSNPFFSNGSPVLSDQPGNPRDSLCDIGAYEVQPLDLLVLSEGTDVPDDTGVVDFGSTLIGNPLTRTFTVKNIGKTGTLTVANLTLPSGFSILENFEATSILTDSQTTFAIQLEAGQVSTSTGQLAFENNVPGKNPFNFTIMGKVVLDEVITGLQASNDSPTMLGSTTTLTATVTGGTNVSYTWDFGDGNSGNGASVNHIYPASGVYTATVTASNTVSSRQATTSVTIIKPLNLLPFVPRDPGRP